MLRRLEIVGFGLIARAEVDFAQGATIFTGETGSGKTMILGALAFVLGARATGGKANVTLWFDPGASLRERFENDGFALDPGEEATLAREMSEAGKSSVRVNGRPATAGYLREIAPHIAEIVGQHEAHRLLAPAYHLELLDRFGGSVSAQALAAIGAAHTAVVAVEKALQALRADARTANAQYDEARFALDDIEAAALQSGEDERLSERRRYLDNVERIAAALRGAHESLEGDERSASHALGTARAALGGIADIDSDLRAMADRAAALQDEAAELATQLSRALDDTEFDAGELESINARLHVLDGLKRKYGPTLEDIFARADRARAAVSAFESRDERTAELEGELARARRALESAARALTEIRKESATRLCDAVVSELKDLALASSRFEVAFEALERIGGEGAESAEFRFSANAGEAMRPLNKTASGGELSRVLLALVVVLASARERAALVFDEIDAGIGGATATAVGVRIGRLASSEQVICVTHLAQLASWADRHYVLEKHEARGSTTIGVREVGGDDERATELARMLSGESHDAALEHARTLLRAVAR
ncbi:MAG TPA: DNA repair protein RecN [Candidatus Baltobacteraceae bacterium]|nr:DNA repair protein RecN [Candidatus Baltobacteraceae bacterium]